MHALFTTLLVAASLVFAPVFAHAQSAPAKAAPKQAAAKKMAKKTKQKVVFQVSDADPVKQAAAIDIANNIMKHYGGPDTVDIEILAFGPGIGLYRADNPLRPRLESLLPSGVRLVVCKNTLDTLERTTGAAPQLIDGLIYVQTGVARIVERVGQGFVLVKP